LEFSPSFFHFICPIKPVTVIASATFASVTALLLILAVVMAESVIPPVLIFVSAVSYPLVFPLPLKVLVLLLPNV
tara:strand:+ start:325 stop:549 length:225 start_codon:yes stop_codon:yes gene_type:complete